MKWLTPELLGIILAVVLSVLRVLYDKREVRPVRILLEGMICGALALTVSYGIRAMGLSPDWAVFAAGVIGYTGSNTVRMYALLFVDKKLDEK